MRKGVIGRVWEPRFPRVKKIEMKICENIE